MKLQPYVDKLSNSSQYKQFHKEYNDAFIVAGFFVLDLEMGNNVHQIDYYVPSKKKIAAFTLDKQITVQMLELLNDKVPEKLDIKTKVDLDQLPGILEDEMKNRNITEEIRKIIAVLQCIDGKKIWNLNCILSGMGILSAHVEDDSRTVLKMDKKSLVDIMKKIPASEFKQQITPQQGSEGAECAQQAQQQAIPQAAIKEKIKKLEELEKELEKEKEELEKEEAKEEQQAPKEQKKQAPEEVRDNAKDSAKEAKTPKAPKKARKKKASKTDKAPDAPK